MLISPVYADRGVSRYDARRACWRCCHCDGLVYLSLSDEGFVGPQLTQRERDEAAEAYSIGYRQFLHYGCNVWLSGRHLLEEDLQRLRHADAPLSVEDTATMLRHYEQSDDELRQRLWHYAVSDDMIENALQTRGMDAVMVRQFLPRISALDAEIVAAGNLFTAQDLEQVRLRVHVSPQDWATFRSRNRNLMPLPSEETDVYWQLDYGAMYGLGARCARCEECVEERAPGLCWDDGRQRLYLHHVCYREIASHHREEALRQLEEALPAQMRAHLDSLSPLALQQLLQMRAAGATALGHRMTLLLDAHH